MTDQFSHIADAIRDVQAAMDRNLNECLYGDDWFTRPVIKPKFSFRKWLGEKLLYLANSLGSYNDYD
jgi:hypothetical protein